MKILVIVPDYPKPRSPIGGIFNEKTVGCLKELDHAVEVLAPCPFAPPLISALVPKWKIYAGVPTHENRNGVPIHRPRYPQVPQVGGPLWRESAAFLFSRSIAREIHRKLRLDIILSFDLAGAGGLGWRIARDLGIPAGGWATGGDVRFPRSSAYGQSVARTLQNLHVVFYQSRELLQLAAGLLGRPADEMAGDRHLLLPRGIAAPPALAGKEARARMRARLAIGDDDIVVLSVGRISREKGAFDLLEAMSLALAKNSKLRCMYLGANPAFDESGELQKQLSAIGVLKDRIAVLPACSHDQVWEHFCAADIFAFPSRHEGMPNSLLEAMAVGIPAVAFAIPPVLEIEGRRGALVTVPPYDRERFADALLRLAGCSEERGRVGRKGRCEVMRRYMTKTNITTALNRLAQVAKNESADRRGGKIS